MNDNRGYYLTYLRKSRADVEKERYSKFETLEVHRTELEALARREGYVVAEVYRELVSGETIAARTEFQKVMQRISDPECRGVIVHAIDRLGRGDPMEYGWILQTFRFSGTLIVTPGRVYDPNNADDIQQLKLQMFVSNIEYEHIRERMRQGSINSAKRGNWATNKSPYGYDTTVVNRNHTLKPNDLEAPIVRRIYQMAADGMNKGAIARTLNNDGIPTQKGKLWVSSRIGLIISNPVYKGMVRYGHTKTVRVPDGMGFKKKRIISDEGTYVLVKGIHEPLVSDELWEQANKKAFEAVPVRRDMTIKNPLAGLIVCEKCGRALVRQDVKNKYGQHFPRLHHAYYTECQCKSISISYVVEKLSEVLESLANNIEAKQIQVGTDPGEIEAIKRAIEAESHRLDKLMELYVAEAITVDEFIEQRKKSDETIERLTKRLDVLSNTLVESQEVVGKTRDAIAKLRDPNISAEEKNTALKSLIKRIGYEELDTARKDRKIRLHIEYR